MDEPTNRRQQPRNIPWSLGYLIVLSILGFLVALMAFAVGAADASFTVMVLSVILGIVCMFGIAFGRAMQELIILLDRRL